MIIKLIALVGDIPSLQGVGAQYGGSYHKIGYNFYVAKATGSYENYFEGNMESVPGNWRVNGSLSYSF